MKGLIERQAVLDLIHENWYASNEFYLKQIEGLPTIDAEPVRHGKWIFESIGRHGVMTCSECRKMQDYQTLCFTYCPNCGARMEEK